MSIREIMTDSPATCREDTSLREVAQMFIQHDCGAIPVLSNSDGEKPQGIVTDRDIVVRLVAEGKNPLDAKARDAMTKSLVTVTPDDDMEAAALKMEENQIRRIVVVDDNGRAIGIVAQADLALDTDEELTGEVVEEVSA